MDAKISNKKSIKCSICQNCNISSTVNNGAVLCGDLENDSQNISAGSTQRGPQGEPGIPGTDGNGIVSIEKTSTSGLVDTYTITFTDGNSTTFTVTNGNGISTIEKTSTVGLVDTYTITFNNGDTETFTVTNGKDGADGADGQDGASATITVGTTTTGNPGTNADVTNSGTNLNAVLNFTIPRGADGQNGQNGADGQAATITVGTTTTGAAGTSASVTNVGTSSAAVFNFTIPQGAQGANGTSKVTFVDWRV